MLQYLYDMYGDIAPEILSKKRQTVETMVFNPALPINVIFNAIEKFTDIAEASGSPITQMQCRNIAYVILKKSNVFSTYLIAWDARVVIQKTWIQFKIDFRQAVKKLRRTCDLKVQQLHANLVTEIITRIQETITLAMTTPTLTISSYLSHHTSIISADPSIDIIVNLNAAMEPTYASL